MAEEVVLVFYRMKLQLVGLLLYGGLGHHDFFLVGEKAAGAQTKQYCSWPFSHLSPDLDLHKPSSPILGLEKSQIRNP